MSGLRNWQFLILVVSAIAIFCSCACNDAESEKEKIVEEQKRQVMQVANEFFASFSEPSSQNRITWGMSDFHVFLPRTEVISAIEIAPHVPEYQVRIRFWCAGKNLQDQPVKLIRDLLLDVARTGDSPQSQWTIARYAFANETPLTFWEQFYTWVGHSLAPPLVVLGFVYNITSGSPTLCLWLCGLIVLLSPFYAALAGYECFGSTMAAVACAVAYGVVLWFAVAIYVAWKNKRNVNVL